MDSTEAPVTNSFLGKYKWVITAFFALVATAMIVAYALLLSAPTGFPVPGRIHISKGTTVGVVADRLVAEGYVRSSFFFTVFATLLGRGGGVQAGDYYIDRPVGTILLANRLAQGDYRLTEIKVTFPEGTSVSGMAMILMKKIPSFDVAGFIALTKGKEGYLFPDTYLLLPNVTAKEVVKLMTDAFAKRVGPLAIPQAKLGATITLASILEEEGATSVSRKIMSDILHKRLAEGMPLQVDAAFAYSIGKSTYELTSADLKIDNPYNTYLHKGLPPTPITNPGLDAIKAALNPTPTDYYFYLTEKDGTVHYARTYEEHLANKAKYIK